MTNCEKTLHYNNDSLQIKILYNTIETYFYFVRTEMKHNTHKAKKK